MTFRLTLGPDGEVRLPEEYRRRWGLSSDVEITVRETPDGLFLRPADPPLSKLYVEPTSLCNLSCLTCVRNSWSEPYGSMSMDCYRSLIDGMRAVPSLKKVSLWGFGEPLLHPNIIEMVALAKELGVETQMISNGLLLDERMAAALIEVGLDSLVISVDGATPASYSDVRDGSDLDAVRHNLWQLLSLRAAKRSDLPEIGLEFVLMRRNVGELARLRQLALEVGASFVVVSHLLPYTEDMKDEVLYGFDAGTCYPVHRSRWTPELLMPRMDWRRELIGPMSSLLLNGRSNEFPSGRWDSTSGYCRFVAEGSMVVGWDGGVSPCVALMHSYPCYIMGRKKDVKRCVLGNVAEESPVDIWRKGEFFRIRDVVQRFDFSPCTDCGGCDLFDSNEEDCFGNVFPTCGGCLWGKGVIQCP